MPVAYEIIHKDRPAVDAKTGKIRYLSKQSKHQLLQQMVRQCLANGLVFKYILADKWYACADTFACLHQLECQFIMPIKANRLVAVGSQPPAVGEHRSISELVIEPHQTLVVWLKGRGRPCGGLSTHAGQTSSQTGPPERTGTPHRRCGIW